MRKQHVYQCWQTVDREKMLYTMADHKSQIEKELQENDFFTIQISLKNYTKK